jgi:hypothetical protein
MSNSDYLWKVTSMMVMPEEQGQTDVVISASYSVTGKDGEFSANYSGVQRFVYDGGSFTPYIDLTEEQVVGWVQDALGENGVNSINANLESQIENQKNPPLTPESLPLPWTP